MVITRTHAYPRCQITRSLIHCSLPVCTTHSASFCHNRTVDTEMWRLHRYNAMTLRDFYVAL